MNAKVRSLAGDDLRALKLGEQLEIFRAGGPGRYKPGYVGHATVIHEVGSRNPNGGPPYTSAIIALGDKTYRLRPHDGAIQRPNHEMTALYVGRRYT